MQVNPGDHILDHDRHADPACRVQLDVSHRVQAAAVAKRAGLPQDGNPN
jgi:hypothetical protein